MMSRAVGHKIGEDVGFPPVVVFILDVVVVEGDVLLYRRGHVDDGVPGEEFFVRERRWLGGSLFFTDFQRVEILI